MSNLYVVMPLILFEYCAYLEFAMSYYAKLFYNAINLVHYITLILLHILLLSNWFVYLLDADEAFWYMISLTCTEPSL